MRDAAQFFVRSYSTWFLRCFLSKFSILPVLFIVRVNIAVCFWLSVQCVPPSLVGPRSLPLRRMQRRFSHCFFHSAWFPRRLLSKFPILLVLLIMVRVSIVNCLLLTIRAWSSVFLARMRIVAVLIRFFPRFFLGIDFCGFWTKLRFSVTRWFDCVLKRKVRLFW